jgi:hypothetical protein
MNNHHQYQRQEAREEKKEKEEELQLLKTLKDMMHNRIMNKQDEVHKTQNIVENDRLSIEVNTLHWVIAQQSLSIRRLLTGQKRRVTTTLLLKY